MANDELLRLSGSTNNPQETVTATANGTAVYAGANRLFEAELRVAGAVSGTSPTLDVKIQESTSSGGSYTDVVSFPQRTASDISGGGAVPGTGPNRVAFRTSKDYVRIAKTIGGSATPTFTAMSVVLNPLGEAAY